MDLTSKTVIGKFHIAWRRLNVHITIDVKLECFKGFFLNKPLYQLWFFIVKALSSRRGP